MDLRKIKALIDLLDKSNLAELEIKEGEESVRLARHSQHGPVMMQAAPMQAPAPAEHRPPAQPMPAVAAPAAEAQVGKNGKDVPDTSASIGVNIFIASMMPSVSPALTVWPIFTKGAESGLGEA